VIGLPHLPADCGVRQLEAQRRILDSWLKAAAEIVPVRSDPDFLRFIGLELQLGHHLLGFDNGDGYVTHAHPDYSYDTRLVRRGGGGDGDSVSRRLTLEPADDALRAQQEQEQLLLLAEQQQQATHEQMQAVARERESLAAVLAERSTALRSKEAEANAANERADRAEALLSTLSRSIGMAAAATGDDDEEGEVAGGGYDDDLLQQQWVDSGGFGFDHDYDHHHHHDGTPAAASATTDYHSHGYDSSRSAAAIGLEEAYATVTSVDPRTLLQQQQPARSSSSGGGGGGSQLRLTAASGGSMSPSESSSSSAARGGRGRSGGRGRAATVRRDQSYNL